MIERERERDNPAHAQQDLCLEELHKSPGLPSAATANGDAGMGASAQKWTDSHMSYVARLGQHQNALQQVSRSYKTLKNLYGKQYCFDKEGRLNFIIIILVIKVIYREHMAFY